MVRFLIGPESSWITGQAFAVDGGQNLRRGAGYGTLLRELGPDPPHSLAPWPPETAPNQTRRATLLGRSLGRSLVALLA